MTAYLTTQLEGMKVKTIDEKVGRISKVMETFVVMKSLETPRVFYCTVYTVKFEGGGEGSYLWEHLTEVCESRKWFWMGKLELKTRDEAIAEARRVAKTCNYDLKDVRLFLYADGREIEEEKDE